MPNTNERDALPCPFCGSTNISDGEVLSEHPGGKVATQSMCRGCAALGPEARLAAGEIDYGSTKAIAAWNRRAATAPNAGAPASIEPAGWILRWPNADRLNLSTVFDTEAEAKDYLDRCSEGVTIVPLFAAAPAQQAGAPLPLAPAGVADLRKAMWLDPECAHAGACQSLNFKALPLAPSEAQQHWEASAHAKVPVCKHCGQVLSAHRDQRYCPATPPQATLPASETDGYAAAFYELAALMGMTAQPLSPETVWREQMLPRLKAALATLPASEPVARAQTAGITNDVISARVLARSEVNAGDLLYTRAQPQADAAEQVGDMAKKWLLSVGQEAQHIRENAERLRKFPGTEDEARARELGAMYLVESAAHFAHGLTSTQAPSAAKKEGQP